MSVGIGVLPVMLFAGDWLLCAARSLAVCSLGDIDRLLVGDPLLAACCDPNRLRTLSKMLMWHTSRAKSWRRHHFVEQVVSSATPQQMPGDRKPSF